MHWTTEQVKQFISGIRHCGRNFHEIQKRYFSANTGIDPLGSRQYQQSTCLRSARGRKRKRGNPAEPSGNAEAIPQQEEPEPGEPNNTPINEGVLCCYLLDSISIVICAYTYSLIYFNLRHG